ncbi:MAG: peptidoglycan DD-metalloendopeptidase family protein [Myxococcales bacterium]|nr:peptidoglycan DD-metalloendopeptidase family protein [Myxococcales bacterium]MCB9669113.1 peptidoglycan DD-metalloendopeptidase family protein [Alphaproteobacteria bacterium]
MRAHPILCFDVPPTVLDLEDATASMVSESPWWIGRYDEDRRRLYATALFTGEGRTVHIGIDLGGPVGTPVYAPVDAVVHAAGYNPEPGDYGYTLVLELAHTGLWLLLGHLSRASVADRTPGQAVSAGEIVGWLGDRSENGDWPPHVHVQLSRQPPPTHDMPGAVHPRDRTAARELYPDPRILLGPLY